MAHPDPNRYVEGLGAQIREQLEAIERAGTTEGATAIGRPIIVLSVLGARSGQWRKVPLMRVEHDGAYAAVASKGGDPAHPQWYYSITANPDVTVQDGDTAHPYQARRVTGSEREAWWERATHAFPSYVEYQARTPREIPVFVLEPR